MEAFSGPSRCVTTEKFVGAYQEQTCYANCGDVVLESSQSSEFEVILNRSTDKISNKLSLSNNASFGVIIILMTTESHNFFKTIFLESNVQMSEVYKAHVHLHFV